MKLVEISEPPNARIATVTTPDRNIYEVRGTDRSRVVMIAALLAQGVAEDEIL